MITSQHGDDSISLTQLIRMKHNGLVTIGGHGLIVVGWLSNSPLLVPCVRQSRRFKGMELETQNWRRLAITFIAIFAAYQIVLQFIGITSNFLMMLLIAWLVSIAIEPVVSWFEGKGQKRGIGAGIVLISLIVFILVFFATLGGLMFSQLSAAVASAPQVITSAITWINSTFDLNLDSVKLLEQLNVNSADTTSLATNLAGGLLSVISSLFTFIFDLLTILVFAFYFSADAHRVRRSIASWLPAEKQKIFVTVWQIAVKKTGGFVISRVVLATISAVAHSLFFALVGIPYWLPMGIFAGLAAQFVPSVGTYIGIIFPALFTLGDDPLKVVWIVIFATIYQQIENYVLSPRISRRTMDLHPALGLGSAFIGVAIFGPIGAFIGVPIVAGVIAVASTYGKRHELISELAADNTSN
jgi:predicted PurR-regulated permease PerM